MKFLKRISSLLLAALLMVSIQVPTYAAMTGTTPASTDTGTVTITNLKEGDQVTFYQIVKANYGTSGFTGFEAVKDSSKALFDKDGNPVYPSAAEIAALAENTSGLTSVGPVTAGSNGTVTKDLAAGEWMALVTPAASNTTTVYNPMVVSVYYSDSEGKTVINGGQVSAKDSYTINGTTANAKSSELPGKKEITGNSKGDVKGAKGDDLAVGDTINFQITSLVPSYGAQYKKDSITYTISDAMDEGLTLDKTSIKVKVGGKEIEADGHYTVETPDDQHFTITFDKAYIQSLANATEAARAVAVTYSAKLNDKATVNFDANNNTATITYTHKPDGTTGAIKDTTHQYTFAIDGNINGSSKTVNRKGHELIKVNEKGEPVSEPKWVDDGTEETTIENGLAGAEFTLTMTKDVKGNAVSNGKTYTATTDDNGYFNGFTGLDAGTYELVETKAPKGYTLNTQKHTVVIDPTYDANGLMTSYTITIDGKNTSTYNATYENSEVKTITTTGDPVTTYIKNTKLSSLPSTGSIGTYLLTALGVAAVAVAIGMILADKKRKSDK